MLSGLLEGGHPRYVLGEIIAAANREARPKGLTHEDIDVELDAWHVEP